MKKVLSILLIVLLALSCLPLAGCGEAPGINMVTVLDMKEPNDSKYPELAEKVNELSDLDINDYVCVLDEKFTDETVIPSEYNGRPVVCLTSLDSFADAKVTKITVPDSVKRIANLLDSGSKTLKSVSLPEGVVVTESFNDCDELEDVDLDKPAEIKDSFTGCEKLKSDVFEVSANAANCTGVFTKWDKYQFNDMLLVYYTTKDAESTSSLDTPKGKWIEMTFEIVENTYSDKDIESLFKTDNILLNGAASSKYVVTIPSGAKVNLTDGSLSSDKYDLTVYFDVPEDFRAETSESTYSDQIKDLGRDKRYV